MINKQNVFTTVSVGCLLVLSSLEMVNAQEVQSSTATDELMEEILVVGTRASLKKARDIERDADVWKNVVVADDIGNFPDQNVAESLQRLPGLSIQRDEGEGRNVIVRGLSPAFNNVTINGVRFGSSGADADTDFVSLDVVPSDLLNGIEVSKTSTPDMDGDAIAGTINLKTLSAFDRKENSLNLRAEGSYSDRAEETSPKLSGDITRLFDTGAGEKTLGVALTGNWSERDIRLDDLRVSRSTGADLRAFDLGSGSFYRPEEIDQRLEIGTRTRYGAALSVEFRPDAENKYYINVTGSRLDDEDVRVQQEWETRRATGSEVKVIGSNTGVFDDVDLEKQIFFQDTTNKVYSVSIGGENAFDTIEVGYQVDYSKNTFRNPLGTRGRFRERDELVFYSGTDDDVIINATPDTADYSRRKSGVDITDPANFNFDGILVDDSRSEDEIYSAKVDVKWNFKISDHTAYIKMGVKLRTRDKFTDKEQLDLNPQDFGFTETLADVGTFNPDNTDLNNFVLIPNLAATQDLVNRARDTIFATGEQFNASNINDDFEVEEDISAAYIMGQFNFLERFSIIAGARLEKTKLDSIGTMVETLRSCDDPACATTTNTEIGQGVVTESSEYTDVLPSINFRYEPVDNLILRLALTKAVKRPAFDENRPNIAIVTEEQDDGTFTRGLVGGNPNLETSRADQVDFLVSWYPTENIAISGGAFYKEIKDFIVEASLVGDGVALSGFPIGNGSINGGFDSVETFFNGSEATLEGVEFSYFQDFQSIPGVFVNLNMIWTDSESRLPDIRPDEVLPLPDQPDFIINFSVGYEDDALTLRVSGNYVGDRLETVSTDRALDEIRQSRLSVDLGARYRVNETYEVYFDAININEAEDVRVFRNGDNAPNLFERIEDYGKTFQLGVRASF